MVKILFRFYSNVLEEWTVETLWATIIDDDRRLYKIDNIPFFAAVAPGDLVFAEYDDTEEMLTYRKTVEYSSNSVIQVVKLDKTVVTNDLCDTFDSMGCSSEKFKEGYFVLKIPAGNDYQPIKQQLAALRDKEIIDYAEPVLSEQHQY